MNYEFLSRIFALLAAVNGILVAAIASLTPLVTDYPGLAKVLAIIVIITNTITPFLPRVQGRPSA
jgi:hypothetical protein